LRKKIILFIILFIMGWVSSDLFGFYIVQNSKSVGGIEGFVDVGGLGAGAFGIKEHKTFNLTNMVLDGKKGASLLRVEEYRGEDGVLLSELNGSRELASPSDWVSEEEIKVYNNKVLIRFNNLSWAKVTDTNSMDPLIDEKTNVVEVMPKFPEDIHAGDIAAYRSAYTDEIILHRVINISSDSKGTYYTLKGDNLAKQDPEKVRFSQIQGVVVAVIY